jgi:hypothetical protein
VYVAEYRKIHGDPDVIQIRKTFTNIDQARLWEHTVLKRLRVINRDDYLNKSDSKSIDPRASSKARTGVSPGNKGLPQSEEIKQKKRKSKPKVTCPHCDKIGGVSVMTRFHFSNCGLGIKNTTRNKLKTVNQSKSNRPIVSEIKHLKKSTPAHLVKQLELKPGWYQLSTDQLNDYLSSLKVLNLGNRRL